MRTEHQHQNHHEQGDHVLEFRVEHQGRQVNDHPDNQRSEQCAIRGAETAEGHGREDEEQNAEAEVPLGLVEGEERTTESCCCLLYTSPSPRDS